MKKLTILVLLLTTLSTTVFPSFLYADKETAPTSRGTLTIQKKCKTNLLLSRILTRKRGGILYKTPTLLVDGGETNPCAIRANPDIRKAIYNSVPIIISQPTKGEIQAITGMGIDPCVAAVVVPKNGGEEFEINVIRQRNRKQGVRALGKNENDLDKQVHTIETIIGRKQLEKSIVKEPVGSGSNHKRWTIIDADPFFWGEQGQFIHVGFQYDLCNVVDPTHRKYLTVQTVGTGVSAGKLYKDSSSHRGFFQAQVSVSVGNIMYNNWRNDHLILERSAPESDNNSNTATISTGVNFTAAASPGVTFTGLPLVTSYAGFGITYTKGAASSFHDFTVNHDPVDRKWPFMKWTYWLSGANGSKIRKEHQAYDLVEYLRIKELPQLAKDSVLMPHMECVYYADGDETGTATIHSSVSQKLVEIRNYVLYHKTNEMTMSMNHLTATIDFSEVHS